MKKFALLFLAVFTALSGYAQTTLTLEMLSTMLKRSRREKQFFQHPLTIFQLP